MLPPTETPGFAFLEEEAVKASRLPRSVYQTSCICPNPESSVSAARELGHLPDSLDVSECGMRQKDVQYRVRLPWRSHPFVADPTSVVGCTE